MIDLTRSAMVLAVAGIALAACAASDETAQKGKRSSETDCIVAADSSACKIEHSKAGGEPIVLQDGAGDGFDAR